MKNNQLFYAFIGVLLFFTVELAAMQVALIDKDSVQKSELPKLVTMGYVDRAVRVKVTNSCTFSCNFCHNEGTELPDKDRRGYRVSTLLDSSIDAYAPVENIGVPDVEDLGDGACASTKGSEPFFDQLADLKKLGFNEIHPTGGEPTSHPFLVRLVSLLRENNFSVKMTSNGQFTEKKIEQLARAGLQADTFSILSLDPEEFLKTQLQQYASPEIALECAQKAIERTVASIKKAKALGLAVKINAVVLGDDQARIDRIVDFAQEQGVTVNLLPSVLSASPTAEDKKKMENLAFNYALSRGGRYKKTVCASNNSNASHHFILPNGTPLKVKFIRDYQPEPLCGDCEHVGKSSCTENFYGVRIEYRGGEPFVRLCVQKSNKKTLMPLHAFLNSELALLAPRSEK